MSELNNDPPLVTRPEPEAPPRPRRPRPGFWEAVVWCLVFLAAQICAMFATVCVVFAAYALAAPQPGQFVDEQLAGFSKAVDPKAQGERPPLPLEFGQAIAYGMLAAQFASLGMIALVLPRRIGPDWKRELGFRRPSAMHVLLVLLVVPGFIIAAGAIQELSQWATGLRPPQAVRALNDVFGKFPLPLTVLAVAIGPGVVEELWCRGFLGRGLSARYGLAAGVLITSLLFALMHVDPSQLLGIALMGAYLHFVYLATRSIWAPVLLHAMNNGVVVLLVVALKSGKLDQVKEMPDVLLLASVSLLIFATVALWTSRAELRPIVGARGGWEDSGWKPEYPGVSEPPPDANVRIGYAVISPVSLIFTFASFVAVMYLGYRYLI